MKPGEWVRASACREFACVEVSTALDLGSGDVTVKVRDSKAGGEGPELEFTAEEWRAFLAGVRAGEFDL